MNGIPDFGVKANNYYKTEDFLRARGCYLADAVVRIVKAPFFLLNCLAFWSNESLENRFISFLDCINPIPKNLIGGFISTTLANKMPQEYGIPILLATATLATVIALQCIACANGVPIYFNPYY